MMDVEPEKQRWRNIAKEWYAEGLADTPGTGKLHHHLGFLSRRSMTRTYGLSITLSRGLISHIEVYLQYY
jgi:hypothetical protein